MINRMSLLVFSLFALWLLMSGVYKPLIIILGLLSCLLCVWIVSRLKLLEGPALSTEISIVRLVRYLFWLTVEIAKADWAVTKVILSGSDEVRQRLIKVPTLQSSDIGKMIFANSITITPGTVTVETEADHFVVHALTDAAADQGELANMGGRVCALENVRPGGCWLMFTFTVLVIFASMVLLMVRLFAGPTLYDRVLAVNTFGTCTVLFIAVVGLLFGRPDFLDIALLYALINFVGTIAILKFFRYRRLGDAPEEQAMINQPASESGAGE